jgi:endonuclease/exonuclease/phosphatase family metal-dependent hydrolase
MPSLVYLALVALVALARARLDERAFVHLVVVYAPGAAWLAPLLWLVPRACHPWDGGALAADGLTLGIVLFGLMDFQAGARRAGSPPRDGLRVVTFNVFGGSIDIRRCLAFLRQAQADVIFLQEAWWVEGHRRVNDTRLLIGEAFSGWHRLESRDHDELMILSRHPLLEPEERKIANRPCLVCTARTPGGDVRLVNIHLDPPATRNTLKRSGQAVVPFMLATAQKRRAQGEALHALLAESRLPTIAAGDFNSPPHAYPRRIVGSRMRDVFATAGRGFGYTYPNPVPLWRIDYILVSPSIGVRSCDAPPVQGSDHRPLVADLTVRPPS